MYTENPWTMEEALANWLKWDNDDETRSEIQKMIASNSLKPSILCPRISFGTAGLRAKIGPGFAQMNNLVVQQTTQGLVKYLGQHNFERKVVIGFDHRKKSKEFARIAACVFSSQGYKVYLMNRFIPTPFIPFAVLELKTCCGIMITASHNSKEYNGYKLYWQNGCQIRPPMDSEIESIIFKHLEPWKLNMEPEFEDPFDLIAEKYFLKKVNIR